MVTMPLLYLIPLSFAYSEEGLSLNIVHHSHQMTLQHSIQYRRWLQLKIFLGMGTDVHLQRMETSLVKLLVLPNNHMYNIIRFSDVLPYTNV